MVAAAAYLEHGVFWVQCQVASMEGASFVSIVHDSVRTSSATRRCGGWQVRADSSDKATLHVGDPGTARVIVCKEDSAH